MPIKQITIHKSTKPKNLDSKTANSINVPIKTNYKCDDSESNESQDSKSKTLSNSSLDLEQERNRVISNMEKMEMDNFNNSSYGNSNPNQNVTTLTFNDSTKETGSELSTKTVRKTVSAVNLSSNCDIEFFSNKFNCDKDLEHNSALKGGYLLSRKETTESFVTAESQSLLDISDREPPLVMSGSTKPSEMNAPDNHFYKLSTAEVEQVELSKKRSGKMLVQIQDQFSKEVQNKIAVLKQQQVGEIIIKITYI